MRFKLNPSKATNNMVMSGTGLCLLFVLGIMEVPSCFCTPVAPASVIQPRQFFQTVSTLNNTDLAQISNQVSFQATSDTLPSMSCAMFCLSQGAACKAFSLLKFASGAVECRTSSNTATVALSGAVVYQLGVASATTAPTTTAAAAVVLPKLPGTCRTSSECPANSTCSTAGTCTCSPGFEAFANGYESCTPIPTPDSSGFQHYPDGFAYKRVAGGATSLAQARTLCSSIDATLPIPYGPPGISVRSLQALRTFARPGEEFYVGMTGTGPFSTRKFRTDNGTVVDANAKATDTAQFWATGEPNANSDSDAAAVTMTTLGWQDKPSSTAVNTVICSKPSGYTLNPASGKYYKMNMNPLTYQNADAACRSEGGQLALTYGDVGTQVIKSYIDANPSALFWVSGTDAAQEGQWVFADGTVLNSALKDTDPQQKWLTGEPGSGTAENCLISWKYGWNDGGCSSPAPSLCERTF